MNKNPDKTPSLVIKRPIGKVVIGALVIIIVLMAAVEMAARTEYIQNLFDLRSLGNYHYLFEIKWFLLEDYVEEHGGVDVILLGSSLTNSGVEPEEINKAYTKATGNEPLRIFNFGVEGLTIQPNSAVARLLFETYHPKVLIFGTEIRDYAANNGVGVANEILSDPWIRYRMGDFNLRGWLAEHSIAYRYYLANRNYLTWDFYTNQATLVNRIKIVNDDGYDVENRVSEDAFLPPDPENEDDAAYFELFKDFEIDPGRIDNLHDMLEAGEEHGVTIIFMNMPVVHTFFDFFEGGMVEYENFVTVISGEVIAGGGYFVPAPPEELIPPLGRSDRVHLNKYGAPIFSRYIGEQLAELVLAGEISFAEGGE